MSAEIIIGVIAVGVVIAVILLIVWSFRRERCSGRKYHCDEGKSWFHRIRYIDSGEHKLPHSHFHSAELTPCAGDEQYSDLAYGVQGRHNPYCHSGVDHQHGTCDKGSIDTLFSGYPDVLMWSQ
jgi:hypothetical protein